MANAIPKVAYLTAGAAGMYCGSCMRDNTLAAALQKCQVDVQLIPTYTPIRTDEQDVSIDRVFYGGINVYLQQTVPLFRYVPAQWDRFLNRPSLIRWATNRAAAIDPKKLGSLTLSMLRGKQGYQAKEVDRLCDWLTNSFQPDLINLSNILIGGCVPELKKRLRKPIVVTLQGDDIFLESLPDQDRRDCLSEIQRIDQSVDLYITFSHFYVEAMSEYLGIDRSKLRVVPLGIDTRDYAKIDRPRLNACERVTPRIGYLARLAPEKGLHLLVDAFIKLARQPAAAGAQLLIAGWLGEQNRGFAGEQFRKLKAAGLDSAYQFFGTVDRTEKIEFLRRLDLLSVPTTYKEPKGIYVLEALAAGVPVVVPHHGAFPELIQATGGGCLFRAHDADHLAETLLRLIEQSDVRLALAQSGRRCVLEHFTAERMAQNTLDCYRELLGKVPVESW
jgi:glycosyltransferase involved in cell wall biosynthesis